MRGRSRLMIATATAGIAMLALSACGGGGGTQGNQAGGQAGESGGGEVVIKGCTPENPLVPGNTSETCGGDIVDAFTAKLVHYNTETADPEMDIAESIESDDNQNFTVKLKQGYKFHDGTEVKAKNFVDAWNYTAAAKNGQAGSYFMSAIEGAEEISAEGATGETMSGLAVVDDYTFTIKTTEKVSNLPVRLGYSAFAPMPDSFFADPKAFEDKPIGAGPFQIESKDTQNTVLTKFADYSGEYAANVDKLTFRVYTEPAAAYTDVVANNLDYTNEIPSDQMIGEAYKSDLTDRNLNRASGRFAGIVFSPNDEQLKENLQLRQALSMAINRDLIAKDIMHGSVIPAKGWAPSVVDGATDSACGEYCTFDAEKAKALYEESGGYDGPLTLTVNGDGAHREWAEAVCNSIKNAVGAECIVQLTPDFATFNKQIDAGELKGMFRTGWQMDYPSIENFLGPIYATGADSNWSKYDNPDFNAKLAEAAAADSEDEANKLYQEAEQMLGQDLPTTPLWYPTTTVGWSDNVTDVKINAFGVLDFSAIKAKN
ncbi:peptide ABC transporter substrate-binding protein [Granulicoccus sp. GXG6511]|uniref:peptide ABC transporter substrate-binding protein n=1 Tax=Granulicoccus sp. GXG6511 TaxID=3381351 RepID=UPI003D7C872F